MCHWMYVYSNKFNVNKDGWLIRQCNPLVCAKDPYAHQRHDDDGGQLPILGHASTSCPKCKLIIVLLPKSGISGININGVDPLPRGQRFWLN